MRKNKKIEQELIETKMHRVLLNAIKIGILNKQEAGIMLDQMYNEIILDLPLKPNIVLDEHSGLGPEEYSSIRPLPPPPVPPEPELPPKPPVHRYSDLHWTTISDFKPVWICSFIGLRICAYSIVWFIDYRLLCGIALLDFVHIIERYFFNKE